MIPLFKNDQQFDGHALYLLYEQCQSNIDSTYRILNSQLNQTLPYLTYIHFLSEIQKQLNPIQIKRFIRYLLWSIWKKIHSHF
jgi:hypothetical protein